MSLPVQVLLIVGFITLFGAYIPLAVKECLYGISLTMKEILVFILPVVIFSYLASCILSFEKGAGVLAFIGILLVSIFVSNFAGVMTSYFAAVLGMKIVTIPEVVKAVDTPILGTLWSFNLPTYVDVKYVLIAGLLTGIIFTFVRFKPVEQFTNLLKSFSNFFLMKVFSPLVPLFILGFMVRLDHEGMLKSIITSYAPLFFYVIVMTGGYIALLFFIFNGFKIKETLRHLKNSIAPAVTGFSTMSSAVTMPFTLKAAELNTNAVVARTVIPATVNPHMIGNAMITPILAAAVMSSYGVDFSPLSVYIIFALYFAVTQFAAAAVPSGAILIMMPHLQGILGFTPGMSELIISLYLLFDAPITAGNVVGNIALTTGLNKVLTKMGILSEKQTH